MRLKKRPINRIIVHCSASESVYYNTKAIQKDHVNNRGWDDIGYHAVIEYDGKIKLGRPINESGAHAKGHNHDSIGICLLGDKRFGDAQFESLCKLIRHYQWIFNISDSQIHAHHEFNKLKSCPNFEIEWLKENWLYKWPLA